MLRKETAYPGTIMSVSEKKAALMEMSADMIHCPFTIRRSRQTKAKSFWNTGTIQTVTTAAICMRQIEHQIAVAFTMWWAYNNKRLGVPDVRLLFAIPNGGLRNIRVAMNLKAEGVRAGIPDYFLAVPRQKVI